MRVLTNVVVLSALLVAATAVAGGNTPTTPAPPPTTGSATSTPMAGSASADNPPAPAPPPEAKPEDMPTAIRMRRLEERTQALKERSWQLKARIQMLKEQMLGGGVGAQAVVAHDNDMGSSFRLVKLVYTLDGTEVLSQNDDTAENLFKVKQFDVFNGPIAPGSHNLTMVATYRGHGYGVFEYLQKFTFTARNTSTFVASEGKIAKVDCRGYEKGGTATPMEKRAAIECKVTEVEPEKPGAPAVTNPGTTPLPASTAGSTTPAPAPAAPAGGK
jgi:hypothetical protein